MKRTYILFLFSLLFFSGIISAQGLLDNLKKEAAQEKKKEFTLGTFKGTRIINGYSTEMPGKGELLFIIQHRFGNITEGIDDIFGLDQASIRMGLEYTMPFYDRINIGLGRSTYMKTWDGFIRYKILKQAKGGSPFHLDAMASIAITTNQWADPTRNNYFTSRLSYAYQLLLSRKFCKYFSMQITPTVIHKNLVPKMADQNTAFYLGFAGSIKVSRRVAINLEYFWPVLGQQFPQVNNVDIKGPLSFGVDWETGGHVFQFHITNATAMFPQGFVAETTGDWLKGDIRIGFNITRNFSFEKKGNKKPKNSKETSAAIPWN
jgi:hypothetical protein